MARQLPTFDPDGILLCPNCGAGYLHHYRVEVFECLEDSDGLHVTVESQKVSVDTDLTGNPSARRHGLTVHFDCELCPALTRLTLAQHKGNTFMETAFTIDPERVAEMKANELMSRARISAFDATLDRNDAF